MMEDEIFRRIKALELAVEAILDVLPVVRDRLRPKDAMAICDAKGVLGSGLWVVNEIGQIVEVHS